MAAEMTSKRKAEPPFRLRSVAWVLKQLVAGRTIQIDCFVYRLKESNSALLKRHVIHARWEETLLGIGAGMTEAVTCRLLRKGS